MIRKCIFSTQPNSVYPPTSLTSCLYYLKVWIAQNLLKLNNEAKQYVFENIWSPFINYIKDLDLTDEEVDD